MIDRKKVTNDFVIADRNGREQIYLYLLLDIRGLLVDIKNQGGGQEITTVALDKDKEVIDALNKRRETLGLPEIPK